MPTVAIALARVSRSGLAESISGPIMDLASFSISFLHSLLKTLC